VSGWYARSIFDVADVERSVDFYVRSLGFSEAWRHADDERLLVAQVDRDGCELILSCQWPDRNGHGLIFISLDSDTLAAARAEFERAGVAVKDGQWGYKLMVIEDPDGNQLLFPYPKES
jgi:catechol 2,3-dioxygenase-like lactoylglutathione lyase family enzyme